MSIFKIKWWVKDEFLPADMRRASIPDLSWEVEAESREEALATIEPQLYVTGRVVVEK